jgi:hypothetical protein
MSEAEDIQQGYDFGNLATGFLIGVTMKTELTTEQFFALGLDFITYCITRGLMSSHDLIPAWTQYVIDMNFKLLTDALDTPPSSD